MSPLHGIKGMNHQAQFYAVLGVKSRLSSLLGKPLTSWTTSSTPPTSDSDRLGPGWAFRVSQLQGSVLLLSESKSQGADFV